MASFNSTDHHHKALSLLQQAEEVVDEKTIQAAIQQIAKQLTERMTQQHPASFPLVLALMGGAVIFCGQLLPQLRFPLEFDYIHASRYGTKNQGGAIEWKVPLRIPVQGRVVIVLDDILDEGETLLQVKQALLDQGAKEVILAVLAEKQLGKIKPIKADYVGVEVPNRFLVGCGMDAYGYWRNLPGIWAI
jgi:hypoxanthine phosphoribosyltransferase